MARFLAIDWQDRKLNVLAVSTGRGKSRVEQSLSFSLDNDLTSATSAALGRAFKEALATANIAPNPVLFVISRDKAVLKDLKIPYVPAHETAAVVRFQTAKELTEAAHESIIDYTLLTPPTAGQQTTVQVAVVRKNLLPPILGLCSAAGLKLQAVIPRPFALAGLLDRATGAKTVGTRGLLIPSGGNDVDLCVFEANRLLWARSLHTDAGLTAEVRKNLVLFAAQSAETIDRIETAGMAELGELPVVKQPIDAWRDSDAQPTNPVQFLGALGAAELAAKPGGLPINLTAAKEPKPVTNAGKDRIKIGLLAAGVATVLAIFGGWWTLSRMNASIRELEEIKVDLDETSKKREQERIDLAALKEWEDTTISWIDELYDLSARLPHVPGLRFTQVSAAQLRRRTPKDAFTGTVTIHGAMTSDQDSLVTQFLESMQNDKYIKAQSPTFKANEFVVKIDVAPRPPAQFTQPLVVPPEAKKTPDPSATPEEAANE